MIGDYHLIGVALVMVMWCLVIAPCVMATSLTAFSTLCYGESTMKLTVDELFRAKVRDREKITRAIHAIDRLRRKAPAGWRSADVLRRLRENGKSGRARR